jgi:hypothetical protein
VTMTNTRYRAEIHKLLWLRAVIASLGERVTPPWWRTQFLTDVGLRAMSRVFPRTAVTAALSSVTIAAQADHDKRIGVGGRYHLFRVPNANERAVIQAMSEDSFRLRASAMIVGERDALIEELGVIANGCSIKPTEGPVRLGSPRSILEPTVLKELAAYYLASFQANRRAFPYFEESEGRV